ncbi:hypothetical protein F5Y17DRAFT_153730 [Xylariaceae sp. FL0594]|nr:hypothetical protein F5Y17DRAFT_153730 [Xylariaceae sp. FL0594]
MLSSLLVLVAYQTTSPYTNLAPHRVNPDTRELVRVNNPMPTRPPSPFWPWSRLSAALFKSQTPPHWTPTIRSLRSLHRLAPIHIGPFPFLPCPFFSPTIADRLVWLPLHSTPCISLIPMS